MIKNVYGRYVSCGDSAKIRSHTEALTEDLIDHIKPAVSKNPDIAVIRTGTNDLQNNHSILKMEKKLVIAVKEGAKNQPIKLGFSSIINYEDEDSKYKINNVNNKVIYKCNSTSMDFIDNSNADRSYLNIGKLHLKSKEAAALAKNLRSFLKSFPLTSRHNDIVTTLLQRCYPTSI